MIYLSFLSFCSACRRLLQHSTGEGADSPRESPSRPPLRGAACPPLSAPYVALLQTPGPAVPGAPALVGLLQEGEAWAVWARRLNTGSPCFSDESIKGRISQDESWAYCISLGICHVNIDWSYGAVTAKLLKITEDGEKWEKGQS